MTRKKLADNMFSRSKKIADKTLEKISDEMDSEAGLKNPFAPIILEILKKERRFEKLSEEDFIKHANKGRNRTDFYTEYNERYSEYNERNVLKSY